MKNSVFMPNVAKLQTFDYQGIVQTLITRTDVVWLPKMALDVNEPSMLRRIEELKEAKLIKLWDYEKSLSRNSRKPDKIITLEEHEEIENCKSLFVEEMMRNSELDRHSDYTTVNIERKNAITNILLAERCGSNSIVQRYPGNFIDRTIDSQTINYKRSGDELADLYTPFLFGKTVMGNLSELSIEDIVDLRKLSKYYRSKIQEYAHEHSSTLIPEAKIKQDCEAIHEEYEKLIQEDVGEKFSLLSLGGDITLEILSCFVSWIPYISLSKNIIETITKRKDRGFVMYMSRLSTATKKKE